MLPDPRAISIADFSYHLPEEKIALFPVEQRDQSKLLVYRNGKIYDHRFNELPELLNPDHLMVFNDTRVVQARLLFTRETGSTIEILCLEPALPTRLFEQAFHVTQTCTWKCLVGNAKRWKEEWISLTCTHQEQSLTLNAKIRARVDDHFEVDFKWEPAELTFGDLLTAAGNLPLPPYLNREVTARDYASYQTIFAQHKGSVAAPTAGLHFTADVLDKLNQKNIQSVHITLHVGAGTFKPVKSDVMHGHDMHAEWIQVNKPVVEQLLNARKEGQVITGIGTTSARTLESIYWFGNKLLNNPAVVVDELAITQWEPYEKNKQHEPVPALTAVLTWMNQKGAEQLSGRTQIIIAPGYEFKLTDVLITNFHQPQSTLLLLIAAFTGNNWKKIYTHALESGYRFLSYGDSSMLYRQ